MKTTTLFFLFTFCLITFVSAQKSDEEKAHDLALEAIQLMDYRKYEAAIGKLEEAQKLDPENVNILYEIGYAQYLNEEPKKAIKTFKKVVKHPDANAQCYQMLGNFQDLNGDREDAIASYKEGLEKFPKAGRLYFELGNVQEDLAYSLAYYEAGIEAEPTYASNYFNAARIFLLNTEEEVWGMIYGEIFMNLERNTERTAQMSQLLYEIYKSEIKYPSDSTATVSFSKTATLTLEDLKDPENLKLPFGVTIYEPMLLVGCAMEKEVNLESLNRIRSIFISSYFSGEAHSDYPNVLFDYQKILADKGFLEAYNYWILMKGDEDAFDVWYQENKDDFKTFTTWFSDNPIEINDQNKFLSTNY